MDILKSLRAIANKCQKYLKKLKLINNVLQHKNCRRKSVCYKLHAVGA